MFLVPFSIERIRFALRYALRHAIISLGIVSIAAGFVFGLLYPPPYQAILGVGAVFLLLLSVDVVCGPLLTLVLANPAKSLRERWLDFSLIGAVQMAALLYGLYSVWAARPVVLAFEVDRLVIVTANEVQTEQLPQALAGLQELPWWGVLQVGTRQARGSDEFFDSINQSMSGIPPAARPAWWLPWASAQMAMAERAKPIDDLIKRSPQAASALKAAVAATQVPSAQLRYIPLTSSRNKEWIVLLNTHNQIVGHVPVDGF